MKLKSIAIAMLLAVGLPQLATAEQLNAVESESTIKFVGSKADGKHEGGFNKFTVNAEADFQDASKSSISFEIDAKSIWSDNDKLTNHLKSPDFFDVRNNPTITFESTEIVPGEAKEGKAKGTVKGKMTMIGKTVEVEIPITAEVNEDALHLKAEFSIDRTKWGMTYGQGKINNDVEIKVDIAFKREG